MHGYATGAPGQSLPSRMASALSAEAYLRPPRTCGCLWRSANEHVRKFIVIMIVMMISFVIIFVSLIFLGDFAHKPSHSEYS